MDDTDSLTIKIIEILRKSPTPMSTRDISIKCNSSWHPVLTRCLKLQIADKVIGLKIGNMNLWSIKK